ncbi:hypothetical protein [uncultured Maricaulis sp.]|uniref:hypothetical protein n=1 Tax=uncultured Maricaulis sp. TaxID=174710 RepID=UPI0030D7EB03
MSDMVKLELSAAEAIILFDALNRLVDSDGLHDDAEALAASALIDRLEGHLPVIDGADYAFRLARAKEELTEDIED